MKKRLAIIAIFSLVLTGLAACNTVSGLGEDVQAGGRAITHVGQHP